VSVVGDTGPFKDAEAWLAERGVPREPVTRPAAPPGPDDAPARVSPETDGETATGSEDPAAPDSGAVRPREAVNLAAQVDADRRRAAAEREAAPRERAGLEDDVARAVAFVRRSTSTAPQAEGRLAQKLGERGFAPEVVRLALERARRERLVDDEAMAAALVEERRRAGHAPSRIRRDLAARGFDETILAAALASAEAEDQEAAAFAVAVERAGRLTGVETEAAYRRVVGYVARRGYPEALARKVGRDAVFATRDAERAAER
jgi:regulatory protein